MKIRLLLIVLFVLSSFSGNLCAEYKTEKEVLVGVPTLLSGDWAGLGENIVNTTKVYAKYYLRHPLKFVYEDAKISGADGLKAYQKLISFDHVNMLIGATSSNGTMAGAPLINSSKTVMITPVTGGSNVDNAGEWIFRLGNSDVLNGQMQAERLLQSSIRKTALFSEETDYTLDVARSFENSFREKKGEVVFSETFLPGTTDFRALLSVILRAGPEAIFIPTQTGSALALILGQLSQMGGFTGQIHTTFTAADNPDAKALARGKFSGIFYMAPAYDRENPKMKEFLVHYEKEFQREPLIAFHAAATVDALDLLQLFLDINPVFDGEQFRKFLLGVRNYKGLLGQFSIDEKGNADTGFVAARIE